MLGMRYSRSPNPLVRWTLGKKLERMARRADFVIVANKFLQSWAEDAGATSVTCIPTVVDLRRYPQTALPAPEPFTIGWIGTPETAPYLDTIKGALKQVLAKENTRLLLVGAEPSFLPLPNVETQSWSEAREANLLQRMHVGIMPLPQGAWEYGKSGYKLVQYMAASRPVVASPVGVNWDVVKEGVNGFFAITGVDREPRTLSRQYQSHLGARSSGAANCGSVVLLARHRAEDRRDPPVGGSLAAPEPTQARALFLQTRSGALRRVKRRRTIPINRTRAAPPVAAASLTVCAVAVSKCWVNNGSPAMISPAIQPSNPAPAQTITGKRSRSAMTIAAPAMMRGMLTARPNISSA